MVTIAVHYSSERLMASMINVRTVTNRHALKGRKVSGDAPEGNITAIIVGSNPTQGMDVCIVCIYSTFVLFYVSIAALRQADPPLGVLPTLYKIKTLQERPRVQQGL
jgi:hypothetical protein